MKRRVRNKNCGKAETTFYDDRDSNTKKVTKWKNSTPVLIRIFILIMIPFVSLTILLSGIQLNTVPWYTYIYTSKETIDPWESPIIHIINTRFMQNQGNLTTLATARLSLFRTICLPSILQQSSKDFIWIIKVDPELNIDIRNALIRLISDGFQKSENHQPPLLFGKVFVIGSNMNFNYGSWREGKESTEVLSRGKDQIYMGNVDLLKMAKKAEPHKIILETRLDADDGLNTGYVAYLHQDAMKKFHWNIRHNYLTDIKNNLFHHQIQNQRRRETEEQTELSKFKWFYWCVETHLKWYLSDGSELGQLGGERRNDFCITPGLTVGYNIETKVEDVPTFGHQQLMQKLHKNSNCLKRSLDKVSKKRNSFEHSYSSNGENSEIQFKMYGQVPCVGIVGGVIGAVRSRTITSTGMKDVKGNDNEITLHKEWDILKNDFGVVIQDIVETKQYFDENLKEIAEENMEGQCRQGHSCKKSSKDKLKAVIREQEKVAKYKYHSTRSQDAPASKIHKSE